MGHTVNFRSHKQSYKDKNAVMNPKEDWLIFENTHEAIVDRETWELAQKLRKTPKRIDTLGEANSLTGLLYCADCGAKMYNQRSRGTESKPYPYDVFECSTYKLAGQKRSAACCGHHISTKALRTLILDILRTVSTFAISNQAAGVFEEGAYPQPGALSEAEIRGTHSWCAGHADLQVLRAGICIQADEHTVLRPQPPGVYLRKLRQGVSYDAKQCQILLRCLPVCSTDQAAERTEESLARG